MNSEEEGGEVSKGGIFSKIHYRDWGWGVRDLWQDPLQRLGGESGIFSKIHYRDWGVEFGIFGKIHYGGSVVCHLRLVLVFCLRIAVYSCSWKFSPRSVPVFDANQIIVAALWVSRPATRLPRSKFRESGAQVTSVSCRISHMIGGLG